MSLWPHYVAEEREFFEDTLVRIFGPYDGIKVAGTLLADIPLTREDQILDWFTYVVFNSMLRALTTPLCPQKENAFVKTA